MSPQPKQILMIAQYNKPEALRMASGLTLLDDPVRVIALGGLADDEETRLQLEALEFADVEVETVAPDQSGDLARLAAAIVAADVVYTV